MSRKLWLVLAVLVVPGLCLAAESGQEGWWTFDPGTDPLAGTALLDLRSLNEQVAGQSGWVRSAGGTFVLGNGKPVKFWGANAGKGIVALPHEQLDYLAARLAKCGVNLLRVHAPLFDTEAADLKTIDAKYLDGLFYFESVLKKQGIYTEVSFYFPLWVKVKPTYGLEGYDAAANTKAFALLFFDPKFQEIYRGWARKLFTTINPYTGVSLGKDPAVAVVEIVNEDGYLFSTFDDKVIPPVQLAKLENKFGAWLVRRYGSIDKALAAWGGAAQAARQRGGGASGPVRSDATPPKQPRGQGPRPGMARRLGDELHFLSDDIRQFYTDTIDYFHKTLGVESLVSCGNWRTVDPPTLEALERYTTMVGDVLDRHGYYFGGKHDGPNPKRTTWKVSAGDSFQDRASVTDPFGPPVQAIEYDGYPAIISELGYPLPNRLRADNTLAWSTYAAPQGVDGVLFLRPERALVGDDARKIPGEHAVGPGAVPGHRPAIPPGRRGRGPGRRLPGAEPRRPVRDERDRLLGDAAPRCPAGSRPPARTGRQDEGQERGRREHRPLRLFRRPRAAGLRQGRAGAHRPAAVHRRAAKDRQEHHRAGYVGLRPGSARGGHALQPGRDRLPLARRGRAVGRCDHRVGQRLRRDPGDQPRWPALACARRILVQAFTQEQPSGFTVDATGKILKLGKPPLVVKNIAATVSFRGPVANATALDAHGYARGPATVTPGGSSVILPADALYTVVER